MPEHDDDVEPDDVTGTDADESANAEVIIDAALVREVTEKFHETGEAEVPDDKLVEG